MAKIWVLVGDDSRARIFRTNRAAPLEEVEDSLNPLARGHEQDLVTDRPGSDKDRVGYAQHAVGGERSPKEAAARRFARRLGERLREARLAGEYERLFLVAPPAFLGVLRQALDEGTRETVVGEMAKDLSRLRPEEIRAHLPELI